MKINRLKGTLDYLPEEMKAYRYVEQVAFSVAKRFGFVEIMTPVIEASEVFVRSAGETSDIVKKEMYTFFDKGERSVTLRPEGTAGVTRAFVENKLYATNGLKKYAYFGPMFRYERPQAGRTRQFNQFGVETYGEASALLDADIINMAYQIFQALGITKTKVILNTLGSAPSRMAYTEAIKAHFGADIGSLCPDCQLRYQQNPLRMLDCKVDHDHPLLKTAPRIKDYLAESDQTYFANVQKALETLHVPFEIDDHLVRGLDYYTSTVFEIICQDESSSMNGLAICAGGRYNSLTTEFDGPQTDAIGFAFGVERMMLILNELGLLPSTRSIDTVVMTLGEENKLKGLELVNELRLQGLNVEFDYTSHNLKPQFKLAERTEAPYIIILGTDEVNSGMVVLKDVQSGLQETINRNNIKERLLK